MTNEPPTRFDAAKPAEPAWLAPLSAITEVVDLNGRPMPCCSVVDGRNQWVATMIPVQFHELAILFAASPNLLRLLKEAYRALERTTDPRLVELRAAIESELRPG